MPASIVQIGSKYAMRLSAGDFARTMTFGNNWTKIRILFTYGIDAVASFTNKVAVGVCNGTAQTYQSASCTDFIGLEIPSATWSPSGGAPAKYNSSYSAIYDGIRKVGSTITRLAGSASTQVLFNGNVNIAFPWAVDIERVWPNYNVTMQFDGNPGTGYGDWNRYDLAYTEGQEDYTFYSTYSRNGMTGGDVYDSVNIHWDASFPCLNIRELMVLRFH